MYNMEPGLTKIFTLWYNNLKAIIGCLEVERSQMKGHDYVL